MPWCSKESYENYIIYLYWNKSPVCDDKCKKSVEQILGVLAHVDLHG